MASKSGLLFAADQLQFGIDNAISPLAGSNSYQGETSLVCSSAISAINTGTDLSIDLAWSKTGHDLTVVAMGTPGYTVSGGAAITSKQVYVTYDDLRIYARGDSVSSTGARDFLLTWSAVTINVDGVDVVSSGAGSASSVALGPQYLRLFGDGPYLTADAQAGAKTGAVSPPSFSDEAAVTSSVSGGWRFKPVGSASWVSLPVTPYDDLSVAAGSAPYGLTLGGIVTTTETWGDHITAYGYDMWARSGSGSCPSANPGPGENLQILRNGAVGLMPDLSRSVERVEAADFAALIYRAGFPEVTKYAYRNWSVPLTIPPTPSSAGGEATVLDELAECYFVADASKHACETEVFARANHAPIVVQHQRNYGTNPLADPCDDFPLTDPLNESVQVQYPYRVGSTDAAAVDSPGVAADMLAALDHLGNKQLRYAATWGNPHWSFGLPPINWDLNGSPTASDVYWYIVRAQQLDLAGLPSGEKRQTRNSIIWDVLEDGAWTAWQDATIGALRWWGVSRWNTVEFTPRTSYVYDSGDSSLFDKDTGALAHGASLTLTPAATTTEIYLDLGDWTHGPYQWPHLATHVTLDWTGAAHITAVNLYAEGADGTRVLIGSDSAIKGVKTVIPRLGDATEYAGSWGIDNGAGVILDVGADVPAGGASATVMADDERVAAFQYLPGDTRERLVIEVTVSTLTDVVFDYPELHHEPPEVPVVVWESGQCAAQIWGRVGGVGGNGLRFGNHDNYIIGSGWQTPPAGPQGAGFKSSVVDGLAWGRSYWTGEQRTTFVPAQLGTLYDTTEGQTEADHDWGGYGVMLPDHGLTAYRMAAINSAREVPPLWACPRKARDSDWAETGDWVQVAWSWIQEPRRFVTPGPVGLHIVEPSPSTTQWTSVEGASPPGWTITRHTHPVTNSEAANYRVFHDGVHYANARPWWGWFAVFDLPDTGGVNVSYHNSWGGEHYRAFIATGTVWWGNAGQTLGWSDFDTGISADWCNVRVRRESKTRPVYLLTEESGEIKDRATTDQGATFSVAVTRSTGSDNSKPTQAVSADGTRYIYWVKGSGPYNVYGCIIDASGAVLASAFAVAGIGNVDDAGIECSEGPGTSPGSRRITMEVVQSGAIVSYESTDGRTFA